MACLLVARDYLNRQYPLWGPSLNFALVGLLFSYNVAFTVWPAFIQQLPRTARALSGFKNNTDFKMAITIDDNILKAQEGLALYRSQKNDAEADAMSRGFENLVAKRRSGTFGPEDARTEGELLLRYVNLLKQSDDLKRLIEGSVPDPSGATPPAPGGAGIRSAPAPPGVSGQRRLSRAEQLSALANNLPSDGKSRIGIVVKSDSAAMEIDRTFYASMKAHDSRITPDAFQEPQFKAQGFFDEFFAGATASLVESGVFRKFSYLFLGRIDHDCKRVPDLDPELLACTLNVSVKIIGSSGTIVDSTTLSAVGSGFTKGAAVKSAVDRLALSLEDEFLVKLK